MTVAELIKQLSEHSSALGEVPDVNSLEVRVSVPGQSVEIDHVGFIWESDPGPVELGKDPVDIKLKAKKLIVIAS